MQMVATVNVSKPLSSWREPSTGVTTKHCSYLHFILFLWLQIIGMTKQISTKTCNGEVLITTCTIMKSARSTIVNLITIYRHTSRG